MRNQRSLCETWRGLKRGFLLDGTTRFSRRGQAVYQNNAVASFAEQVVVPEISVASIDKRMPLDLAALIGCAVITGMGAARHVANIKRGDVVAVIGCGGVGLNMIDAARLAGASAIVAVDIESWKLDLAHRFGATHSVKVPDDDPTALVLSLTDGRGADVALAAAGPTSSVLSAIRLTRQGGEMVAIAGEFGNPLVLPFAEEVVGRARTIRGCVYGNANIEKDFNDLAQLYLSGRTLLDELVTQRVPLERINDAMDDLARGRAARSLIIYPTGLQSTE